MWYKSIEIDNITQEENKTQKHILEISESPEFLYTIIAEMKNNSYKLPDSFFVTWIAKEFYWRIVKILFEQQEDSNNNGMKWEIIKEGSQLINN